MSPRDFEVHQEDDALPSRRVVLIGVVGIVVGAIGVLVAGLLLVAGAGSLTPSFAGPRGPSPAPSEISEIEQTPILDTRRGEDLRARQRLELDTCGWADRDAGIARIPIERAMDLVAQGHP